MRVTALSMIVALGAAACGSGSKANGTANAATTPGVSVANAAPAPAAPAAVADPQKSQVIEIKMTGDGTTKAAFEPAAITIKPGTVLQFVNVSGGPHNIAFWADSIPKGAAEALKKGMPNAMGDLVGPFMTQPNEKYEVSFAGAPTGVYHGYCMPHIALGMHIVVTVK